MIPEMTKAEFLADASRAFDLAREHGSLRVTRSDGRYMVLCFPKSEIRLDDEPGMIPVRELLLGEEARMVDERNEEGGIDGIVYSRRRR